MARPTKCTEALIAQLVEELKGGIGRETAAKLVGIAPSTLQRWLAAAGTSRNPAHQQLAAAVDKAEAEAERTLVKRITSGDERWQSAAWWLERKYPDRWGRRDRLDITHDVGRYVREKARFAGIPDADIEGLVARAEAIATGRSG